MYKPLPESVTIKTSKVNGLGLFANQKIMQGTNLGMTHLKIGDTIFRTPLGGFINHANEPNCVKAELRMTNENMKGHAYSYKKWNLITTQDIKEEEELTLRYTFYNIWELNKIESIVKKQINDTINLSTINKKKEIIWKNILNGIMLKREPMKNI